MRKRKHLLAVIQLKGVPVRSGTGRQAGAYTEAFVAAQAAPLISATL